VILRRHNIFLLFQGLGTVFFREGELVLPGEPLGCTQDMSYLREKESFFFMQLRQKSKLLDMSYLFMPIVS
jgi:hypothetical protein